VQLQNINKKPRIMEKVSILIVHKTNLSLLLLLHLMLNGDISGTLVLMIKLKKDIPIKHPMISLSSGPSWILGVDI
jgi:hypothetical protein